ncbi:SDR family oxidoreductase [Glaciihabitans sp. UYNi722]|uniref:SDR family NAD(P)-dependent oxidoreductase n=1 Tax=Glaciihabitans sp. UYNi722 TaxID=3156344 RepID=UPI0033926EB5
MTDFFQGKTALITGAGRGIGQAIALHLAREGAAVILAARSTDQLAATVTRITAAGGEAVAVPADLSTIDGARHLRDAVTVRTIDILINNAAVVEPLGATTTVPLDDFQTALTLNVVAPLTLTAGLLPGMIARGWGRVVNISSGIVGRPGNMIGGNAYATSKAALEAHTQNLAAEVEGTGVTVNAYRPGSVDTAMQEWIRNQDPTRIGETLSTRFRHGHETGALLTPDLSAATLVVRLSGTGNGEIWDVSDPQ